ncbi:DddA-like double-stranded DNA deaminase toxin [Kribbella monticola]|uniref:DddA-like double-stranded DNA deaminase toxin n=1 Tax=Kribbella monticola TaxID=2185285 RepID=UPI000DD41D14|nr:DddA-like double-stranded DNA deaminase toxin [Kribbella monticola]
MVSGVRTAEPAGGSITPGPTGPGGSPPAAERRQNEDNDKPEANKSGKPAGAGDDDSPEDAAPRGRRITDEDGYRLQQELPDRELSRLSRPKTRGTWVDENGDKEDLVSGQHDEWFQKVTDFLRERGIPPRDDAGIMSPSHVETKFAMRMRLRGLQHETIMVNKLPCKGQFGCEELLRDILPPGSTLTVFGPKGFKETYPLPTDE